MSRIGVRLENDPRLSVPDLVELATLAERLGFEVVWVPEGGGRDALTLLASFAGSTSTVKLATGILPIFSRTPMAAAMSAAGLAAVSDGRFILGLGTGHQGSVETGHGVPFGRPLQRTRETLEIVAPLLSGEKVSYDGQIFTTRNAALGRAAPEGGVPIYIAALMPRMSRLAGELADGVLFNWTASAYLPQAVEQVRDGARRAGRPEDAVDIAGYVRVAVTEDEEPARMSLQRQIAGYARNAFYRDFFAASGFADEMAIVSEAMEQGDVDRAASAVSVAMQDEIAVVGLPDHCRAEIERRRSLGLGLPGVAPFATGDVKQSYVTTMEAFAQ